MSREWIKLHRKLRRHPKYLALTPAERSGYIAVLIEAEPYAGVFETETQLREVLGTDYRYVTRIRAVKLMKGLKVHRYGQSIEAKDGTNADRQRRYRELRKAEMPPVTVTDRNAVTVTAVTALDETRRDETRKDETGESAADAEDWKPPMHNPSVEIQRVVAVAHEQGWLVRSADYAAIVRDFRRGGRLAVDYETCWSWSAKPIENPWAYAYSRADGKKSNVTLVELATLRRLEGVEISKHEEVKREEAAHRAALQADGVAV